MVFGLSKDTNDICVLYKKQSELLDEIAAWYEKNYGYHSDKEANDIIMDKFWNEIMDKYCAALQFVRDLILNNVNERIVNVENLL